MKIYIIGDSISMHYGPYLKQDLAGVMDYARKEGDTEALLNLDNPQGANGGDSSMVLAFLKGLARSGSFHPDLLLVNCGLHDIKRHPETGNVQVAIDDYERNLRAIVSLARKMQVALAWVRTTPCDDKVHNQSGMAFHRFSADCAAYNAVADRVMAEAAVPAIDLHTFTCNLGPDLYCDHVHFHEHVREKQAAFLAGWLNAWMQGLPVAGGQAPCLAKAGSG
jgi:lysophospholipase L1-like esterase